MVDIRKAEKSDHNEYIRMRKLLWPDCSDERHELEVEIIFSSSGVVFVAELSKSNLVGFAEISIHSDHVEGTRESPGKHHSKFNNHSVCDRWWIGIFSLYIFCSYRDCVFAINNLVCVELV
ncbi:MAG: hypothetical protein GY786_03240 [Proteobacteria bacterium]|nr:hypothetical protein [Pseudomonadota bacterium]